MPTDEYPCGVPGCGKPVKARGLCENHYRKALRNERKDEERMATIRTLARVAMLAAKVTLGVLFWAVGQLMR